MVELTIDGLSAGYGRHRVLHGISMPPVRGGEIFGILGPNGSGKSTMLRCLCRELALQGRVTLDGVPLGEIPWQAWHDRIAAVPQDAPMPSALRPMELLWSMARASRIDLPDALLADRIDGVLARLGLAEQAFAPMKTLSGGQRQRVGIAMAMVRDTIGLFLDEPTSALDLHWRYIVLDLLRDHTRDKSGLVIVVLHDLDLALQYCDRIALLHEGRLVGCGAPADILTPGAMRDVYRVDGGISRDGDGLNRILIRGPL